MESEEIIFLNILMSGIVISSKYMNFRDIYEILFKISLKMHYPMIFNLLDNLIFLVLVFLVIYLKAGLIYFIIIYVISNLPGFILLIYYLSKKFNYRLYFNHTKLRWLFRESLPIFGCAILSTIFIQADIIMLKYLGSDYSAGIYAGATRFSLPLAIIPTAIISSVFPILVKNAKLNNGINNKINSISIKFLFLISFFIALAFSFKKTELTILIFGYKYADSSTPSELLLWGNVFLFFNFYAVDLFTAYNKQIWSFYYSIIAVVITLAANFVLIPYFSYTGPAISKIIAGFFASGFMIYCLKKIEFRFEIRIGKLLLMLITMIGLLFMVSYFPLFVYLPLTIALFIVTTLLTKYFSSEELDFILSQFGMPNLSLKFRKFYY
jgi:O-antigen/teichoic acid export membrane protein